MSLGFSGGFFLLETFSRLLPATDIFLIDLPLTCENPKLPSYDCLYRRKKFINGRFIRGKLPPFPIDVNKKTNDIGQFSDINFEDLKDNNSLNFKILSIGDSFVEASQVKNENSFHGLLNKLRSKNNKKVISTAIGAAGNAFPQYLINLYYANENIDLRSTVLIIPIISNDFDESLKEYNPGYHGAKFSLTNQKEIIYKKRINNLNTSFKRFIIKNSYLARYLLLNIRLTEYLESYPFCAINRNISCEENPIKDYSKKDEVNMAKNRLKDSMLSTDIFFKKLNLLRKTKLEKKNTIFVIDGDRAYIYNQNIPQNKFFKHQINYFKFKASKFGYTLIDMNHTFSKHYKINKKSFNFVNDFHWNNLGHQLVFEEISEKLKLVRGN